MSPRQAAAQPAHAEEPSDQREGFANRPETIKAGHGVQVKIWTNHGQNGDFQTVSVERSWKEGEEWKTKKIDGLSLDSLLSTARALENAHDAIMEKQQSRGQSR